MNQSDAYYRALLAYRRVVAGQRECQRDRAAFMSADGRGEITVTRAICTVDEEWIHAIETGLIHIEKAIKEERQFIYSNGEVIPIEKVKHVSKDSVEHLARHADLITRVQEGEDLIPDKLYTVERLSDYAVYENRFLYMLLCYLRDFVTIRYQKILELTNRYNGCMRVDREAVSFGRTVSVHLDMQDVRRDDPYLREHNPAKELIDRMDLILKTITAFLSTPLMESAGKAAMLKPPITKTNVLKMDNNFKGAVALYDYIIAYEADGYTLTEEVHTVDPFGDESAEEMAELQLLMAHLTYRHGLDLGAELKARFEHDENQRRLAELREHTEQLEALSRRLERLQEPQEEYLLGLEKQVRALQHEVDRQAALYGELDERKKTERELHTSMNHLKKEMGELAEAGRQAELAHATALYEAEQDFRQEKALVLQNCANEKEALRVQQAEERAAWAEEAEAERARSLADREALQQELEEQRAETRRLAAAYEEILEEKRLLEARVLGQRAQNREVTSAELEAMTDQKSFDELERELVAFVRLYERVWTKAKRRIRKDLLNLKYIKEQSGKS